MEKLRAGMVWAVALGPSGCSPAGAPRPGRSQSPSRPPVRVPRRGARRRHGRRGGTVTPPDAYALVGTALDLRGVRYRNGGADPGGFDCSGFTQYVFARHGVKLPRSVRDQFDEGTSVRPEDVREGDLLFFSTDGPGASHVGIAVGGDSFVHAPEFVRRRPRRAHGFAVLGESVRWRPPRPVVRALSMAGSIPVRLTSFRSRLSRRLSAGAFGEGGPLALAVSYGWLRQTQSPSGTRRVATNVDRRICASSERTL